MAGLCNFILIIHAQTLINRCFNHTHLQATKSTDASLINFPMDMQFHYVLSAHTTYELSNLPISLRHSACQQIQN